MTSKAEALDAVVVGAGWAGLGASHALAGWVCAIACSSAAASARPGEPSAGNRSG